MRKILSTLALGALAVGALTAPANAADFDSAPHLARDAYAGSNGSYPDEHAVLGSRLVYQAGTLGTGYEPWVTDGTTAGTRMLRDIYPGATGSGPIDFVTFKGHVYFSAGEPTHGTELWRTDGTPSGTKLVVNLPSTSSGSYPEQLVVAGNLLYFTATTPGHGQELWKYDGKAAPALVKEIAPGDTNAQILHLSGWGNKVVFRAEDTNGAEPWVSDGTAAGTHTLGNISTGAAGSFPDEFTPVGSKLYFAAHPNGGNRTVFMSTGGSTSSQVSTANFDDPNQLTAYGSRLLFTATNVSTGRELWVTDGNDAGTVLVKEIRPGSGSSNIHDLTPYRGRVYFAATDGTDQDRLWSTDGSAAGTKRVTTETGLPERFLGGFLLGGGLLYFSASTGSNSLEVWQTDGSAAGTRTVRSIAPGGRYNEPKPLAMVANTLFFSAYDAAHGVELWAFTTRSSTTRGVSRTVTRKAAAKRKVYVTVTVRAPGTTPTGRVVLKKGTTVVGTQTLAGGNAKVRITKKLRKGKHKLRAYYSGSVQASTSSSSLITIKVR